jgi:hypothetical protein
LCLCLLGLSLGLSLGLCLSHSLATLLHLRVLRLGIRLLGAIRSRVLRGSLLRGWRALLLRLLGRWRGRWGMLALVAADCGWRT